MPGRDDDPIHPNYDGLTFRATTDRKGIIAIPTSAQTPPPYTYLPLAVAVGLTHHLTDLIAAIREQDANSYAATYFDASLDDLVAAIELCRPPPEAVTDAG